MGQFRQSTLVALLHLHVRRLTQCITDPTHCELLKLSEMPSSPPALPMQPPLISPTMQMENLSLLGIMFFKYFVLKAIKIVIDWTDNDTIGLL